MPSAEDMRAALGVARAKRKSEAAATTRSEAPWAPADVNRELHQASASNGYHDANETSDRRIVPMRRPALQLPQAISRALPHSVDMEQGVLGSMIIEPATVIPELRQKGYTAAHFYVPAHQTVFNDAVALFTAKGALDLLTLTQFMRDAGHLDEVGGEAFITSLFTFVPTAINLTYYLDIVGEKHALRELIALNTNSARRAYDEQDDPRELIERFREKAQHITIPGAAKTGLTVRTVSELFAMTFDDADNYFGDRILAAGQACTLLGPGGVGKSRLSMQMAICMIVGRPFLNMCTHAADMTWLFIQTENSNRRLMHDAQNIVRSLELSEAEVNRVNKHLLLHTIENDDDAFLSLVDPGNYSKIHLLIQSINPDFIQWDPLNSFTDADLNSDMDMRAVVSAITRVSRVGNPNRVSLVLHHSLTGRAGAARAVSWDKSSYGRNSKVLQAWTRAQINLSPRSGDDPSLLLMSCGKNNNGKMFPEIGIRFDDALGIYLLDETFDAQEFREEVGLKPAGLGKRATAPGTKDDVLALVPSEGDIAKNALLSAAQSKGIGVNRVRGLISELLEEKQLFASFVRRPKTNREVRLTRSPQEELSI